MSDNNAAYEAFCANLDKAAKADPSNADFRTTQNIMQKSLAFLEDNAVVQHGGMSASLESFEAPVKLNSQINLDDTMEAAIEGLIEDTKPKDATLTSQQKLSLTKQIAAVVTGNASRMSHFTYDRGSEGAGRMSLDRVVSPMAYATIQTDANLALEAFGADIDNVSSDVRLAVTMTILRQYKSLADRVFARISETQNVVTIKVPENQVYDLSSASAADAATRNGNHLKPLVTLYRNADPVNTAPKKVIPLAANDTGTPTVMLDTALKTGLEANLFDLSVDANKLGHSGTDFTDLIAEGGTVSHVYVEVTNSVGPVVEVYKVPVGFSAGARFSQLTQTNDSGDRIATFKALGGAELTDGGTMSDGGTTAIFDTIADYTFRLNIDFSAKLNLKTGNVSGSGTVVGAFKANADGSAPGAGSPEETLEATLSAKVIGYDLDVYFSEENVRKSTVAVRQNMAQHSFEIPPGRTAVVDISIQQSGAEGALDAVSTVNNLGNSARTLSIIDGTLTNVAARNAFEDAQGGYPEAQSISREYAAGSQVLPRVVTDTLDFSTEAANIAVMRESERMTEMHARVSSRILKLTAEVNNLSLYHNVLEPGETLVYKVVAHSKLVDLLFGIPNYHNALNDAPEGGRASAGADYSMMLANGIRLDIYKTDFDSWQNRIVGMPVRIANAEDLTSFGTLRDRGTYVGSYTVSAGSAANKRFVSNSREILFVSDPVAFDLTIANLNSIYSI